MGELPTGTVTFLFTDVEGSTQLWERDHLAMRAATVRHNAILGSAIAEHGGHHFKTIGDAFLAAFAAPTDAIAAAAAAQRSLAAEHWGETGPLRVRMAIHLGEATPISGDYVVAPCLNRLARLLATGYGGQVLLSDAVRRQVVGQLPAGATLHDLGRHRLRDLLEPEQVAQLTIEGLPDHFPPLKSLERSPTNLPIQPTPLVGREADVDAVKTLLSRSDVRLVTLTGPGGTGKTRLALQAAAELLERFDDGAFLVDLAGLTEPKLVLPQVAATLGVREGGGQTLRDAVVAHLADKRLLLVLDNFEHLLAAAPDVAELLGACTHLRLLVTSRAPLRLRGEREYPVPPLALPDPARLQPVAELAAVEAVALFVQRTMEARPDFTLTDENGPPIAMICARLDGLPLAIELAAARTRTLEPAALLARLDRRLKLLTGGARDLPPRQQTLRATIAWSHDLLSPDEQALFRRLSVFSGGGSIEAAEAVVAGVGELDLDVLDGAEALIERSLLRRTVGPDHQPRFAMLETLREFGLEKLAEAGEAVPIQQAHSAWCIELAEQAEAGLKGPAQAEWLRRLEIEHDNLRATLSWSALQDSGAAGLRLVRLLSAFWHIGGHLEEGRRWVEAELGRSNNGGITSDRLWALIGAGTLAFAQGDYEAAARSFEQAMTAADVLDDRQATAALLNNLGSVAHVRGDLDLAASHYQQSLAAARELGELRRYATALANLGAIAHYRGDEAAAIQRYEESLGVCRQLGDAAGTMDMLSNLLALLAPHIDRTDEARALGEEALGLARELGSGPGEAFVLSCLGLVAETTGELERATGLHQEALSLFRRVGDRDGIARALGNLGAVAYERGDLAEAANFSMESINRFTDLGDPDGAAYALETLAAIAITERQPEQAVRWLGAADGLRDDIGSSTPAESRQRRERVEAHLQVALTPDARTLGKAAARSLSLDEVREEVLNTHALTSRSSRT